MKHTDCCFTYGSLMVPQIMARACGCALEALRAQPAVLPGYVRHPVRGQQYPGIRPQAGARVEGILYAGLQAAMLERLDAFEGAEYLREEVEVELADGLRLKAWAYVFRAEFAERLLPGEWSFERFLQHGRSRFEAEFTGFSSQS